MAKKGKKSWRSIDVSQIEDTLQRDTHAKRHGHNVDEVPDSELFVIDTAQDGSAVTSRTASRSRKKETKPLRCQVIIGAAHKAKVVNPGGSNPKLRGPVTKQDNKKLRVSTRKAAVGKTNDLDLWGSRPLVTKQPANRQKRGLELPFRAVEVDAPGCSYNPDPELHQDALAEAVAAEMTKQYADEMLPKPIKVLRLPPADELEELLVDIDAEAEEEDEEAERHSEASTGFKRLPEKKTRAQRNRDRRRRGAEAALGARRSLKRQRRDLDSLKQLQLDIEEADVLRNASAARRAADKEDAARQGPPRLGRHKFEPAPLQVLLSEEVGGSLRQLKGTPMLANDRFKSLQKRGVIEARPMAQQRQKRRKHVLFTPGETSQKLKDAHEETMRFLKAGAKLRAEAKKAN